MKHIKLLPFKIILMVFTMLTSFACSKKPADTLAGSSETSKPTQPQKPATDPLFEEARKQTTLRLVDNWTLNGDSSFSMYQQGGPHYIEARGLITDYRPVSVSEADKLNGIEWMGSISYASKLFRIFEPKDGKWGEWIGHASIFL